MEAFAAPEQAHVERTSAPRHGRGAAAACTHERAPSRRDLAPSFRRPAQVPVAAEAAVRRAFEDGSPGRALEASGAEAVRELASQFPHVRIHDDERAASLAAALDAEAFTRGDHVYLGAGALARSRDDARALVRHELGHVAQQARGEVARHAGLVVPSSDESEAAARSGAALRLPAPAPAPAGRGVALQRQEKIDVPTGPDWRPPPPGPLPPRPTLKTLHAYHVAADAFHGIQLYYVARYEVNDEGVYTPDDPYGSTDYLLVPHLRGHGDATRVVYFLAYNPRQRRAEYLVGPHELDAFLAHEHLYAMNAAAAYPLAGQPAEYQALSALAGERMLHGDVHGWFRALGASWAAALRSPQFYATALPATAAPFAGAAGGATAEVTGDLASEGAAETASASAAAKPPPIALGEIKPAASYNLGIRQLASRGAVEGNTALVTFDNAGNVHMQVFAENPATGIRQIIWEGQVGTVDPLPPGTPGTGPWGNAMEPLVRDVVSEATGQSFASKASNAPGPDLVPLP